jgi:drug/metabolite transporter (DMT)-like permease
VSSPAPIRRFGASFTKRWLALSGNMRGIIWISVGSLIIALTDGLLKHMGGTFHPVQLSFCRYVMGFLLLAAVFWRMGRAGELKSNRMGLHWARLFLATIGQTGIFIAMVNLKLADATAFWFSKPLFTSVAAVFILAEIVPARRWVATMFGFAGVVIMMRPGIADVDPYVLVAIGAAFSMAFANVLIRVMAPTEPPNRILFYYHVGGVILLAPAMIWFWQTPVGVEWLLIAMIGTGTTIGMICFVRGFSVGEINVAGPMEYVRLVYAGLIGYFFFAETIDLWTLLGGVVIVASALYIAQDESRSR